jgi:DNA repair exonuclease SbcCD nuclease subunit
MAPAPLEEGDQVQVNVEGDFFTGIIKERRGSGWYSVGVPSNDGEDIIKVRGGQLSPLFLSDAEQTNTTSVRILNDVFNFRNLGAKQSESLAPPPPTIIDLDAAIATHAFDDLEDKRDRLFMQQCAHHASFDRWVMFTDLHCAPSSLVTCLEVLRTVHGAALDRNAGVIFLGDFWHQRAVIRVNVLNAILDELRSWEVPLVMIPGNHDQVTLGGHTHGLTPLENAYQIDLKGEKARSAVPGPLIFSYPTKFRDALFVPHIRDNTVMETVLQSSVATESVALLVHADITGAYMNDLLVSSGGVSPAVFPSDKPIYSGHFHKPHAVKSGSVRIDYVGSTYETSLAEAQQPKALWVVDAGQNWDCVEKIPIHVGRKHFRAVSINEFAKLGVFQECNGVDQTDPDPGPTSSNEDLMAPPIVRAGDRVVVSVAERELEEARRAAHDGETNEFDAKVKALRSAGALVEVREVKSAVLDAKGMIVAEDVSMLEEMTPQKALAAFCSQEARRENMSNSSAEELLKAGLLLIDDLELSEGHSNAFSVSANTTSLVVQSVAIKGFGPFKDEVKYPLLDRGLVLLRGTNRDGGSDRYGKSHHAMSS